MTTHRAGFIALLGRPNVGKSTLLNTLLGEKVAIVSPKPQTTRSRIHGILNHQAAQLVLVDTPGLTHGQGALARALRRTLGRAASDADVALVVTDCHGSTELSAADREVLAEAQKSAGKVLVAINKVDLLARKDLLLPRMAAWTEAADLAAVVPTSAKSGEGTDALLAELTSALPESPPLFPKDMHTDAAERFLCAELVREQLLAHLHDEVPHATAVVIERFDDERDSGPHGLCRLEGRIYVERESQKAIVVGRGGSMIKSVSQAARCEMEDLLGCKVYLRLTVAVERDWTTSERAVQRFGLQPDEQGDEW